MLKDHRKQKSPVLLGITGLLIVSIIELCFGGGEAHLSASPEIALERLKGRGKSIYPYDKQPGYSYQNPVPATEGP